MKIRWSPTAVSDLNSIRDYIARDSPAAARKVAGRIKESVNRLINFPLSGKAGRYRERANWSSPEPPTLLPTQSKMMRCRLLPCCMDDSVGRNAFKERNQ